LHDSKLRCHKLYRYFTGFERFSKKVFEILQVDGTQ
jgi:hypothetical protein